MSTQKSKYPDFTEVIGMASKLFSDVQKSVVEIANDYKEKRKATADVEAEVGVKAKKAADAAAAAVDANIETKATEKTEEKN